jgi:hypothetical protein
MKNNLYPGSQGVRNGSVLTGEVMAVLDSSIILRGGTYVFNYKSVSGSNHYFVAILPLRGADMTLEFQLNGLQASSFGNRMDTNFLTISLWQLFPMFYQARRGDYWGTPQSIDVPGQEHSLNSYCTEFSQMHWNGPRRFVTGTGIDNSIATVHGYPLDTAVLNYYLVGRAMGDSILMAGYAQAILAAAIAAGNGNPWAKSHAFEFGFEIGFFHTNLTPSEEAFEAGYMYSLSSSDTGIGPWAASLWPNQRRARNVITRQQHFAAPFGQYYLSRPGFLELTDAEIAAWGIPGTNN